MWLHSCTSLYSCFKNHNDSLSLSMPHFLPCTTSYASSTSKAARAPISVHTEVDQQGEPSHVNARIHLLLNDSIPTNHSGTPN